MHDFEFPESVFESAWFARFCVSIRDTVAAIRKPACTRDMKRKRAMSELEERHLLDALSYLETVGAVRLVRELPVRRWESSDAPPAKPKAKQNWQLTPAKAKRPDSFEYREARA